MFYFYFHIYLGSLKYVLFFIPTKKQKKAIVRFRDINWVSTEVEGKL